MGALLGQGTILDNSLSDGLGDCSGADKKARAELERTIARYLTQEDMNRITMGLRPRIQPNPQSIAFFEAGEGDCKHKNVSNKHKQFRSQLQSLLRRRMAEAAQQQQNQYTTQGGSGVPATSTGGTQNGSEQQKDGSGEDTTQEESNTMTYVVLAGGTVLLLGISAALLN